MTTIMRALGPCDQKSCLLSSELSECLVHNNTSELTVDENLVRGL